MSNVKTGIAVDASLVSSVADAHESGTRTIKVSIINDEQLSGVASQKAVGSWNEDLSLVDSHLVEKEPCFVLFRTDNVSQEGKSLWYMFCFVPDDAKVKQKMLYASTRSTLKDTIGALNFLDEIHGTERSDFSLDGFAAYEKHKASAAPKTEEEKIKEVERAEGLSRGVGGGVSYGGVSFPLDNGVNTAFGQLTSGQINYIQLAIDMDAELIQVASSGSFTSDQVGSQVPVSDCAFHFYKWDHQHEGQSVSSLVFAFSCPDGSGGAKGAPVKQRMLYASSKANVMGIPSTLGLEIDCKMDIANGEDFAESEYSVQIHPPPEEEKVAFKKPSARGRKGR